MTERPALRTIRRVCVFCGSNTGIDAAYRAAADELGREIASGKEAREIYRIDVQYDTVDETLAANGMAPNRTTGVRNLPLRAA